MEQYVPFFEDEGYKIKAKRELSANFPGLEVEDWTNNGLMIWMTKEVFNKVKGFIEKLPGFERFVCIN